MQTMTDIRKDDTRNLLADIQLFAGLTPTELDWVAQRAHRRVFEAGRNVMTIEQPGEAVYIILYGTVKIHIEQGDREVICFAVDPAHPEDSRISLSKVKK